MSKKIVVLTICAILTFGLAGCKRSGQSNARTQAVNQEERGNPMTQIMVQSQAFSQNQPIPKKHTGEGEDISPPLSWSGLPQGTQEIALITDDPDAPVAEPWVHWLIYKIPPQTQGLSEGIETTEKVSDPAGALQGENTGGTIGYHGPMPPRGHGVHHYHFKVYALDTALNLKSGIDKKALLKAMAGHILAEGELVGTYQR
ncbi:MAG: YbhB/YbcL family Raf kinase inhibitor-like protein [Phycisphaerae bacterium]